jgi:hypothetical protein
MAGLTSEATGLIKEMINADGGLPNYNVRGGGCGGRGGRRRGAGARALRARARRAGATPPLRAGALEPRAARRPTPCRPVPPTPPPQEDLVTRTLNMTGEYSAALGKLMR